MIALAFAPCYVGAMPVFADCDPETWTITAEAIEAKLTPRTRAIIVVTMYGHPPDMEPILALASATASR
jgi:perosamine synthetase